MAFAYPVEFDAVCVDNVAQIHANSNVDQLNSNISNNISPNSGIELNGIYNVYALQGSGVHGVRNILRSNRQGTKIDLWYEDDQSGTQQWKITNQFNSNTFNIEVVNGVLSNNKLLNCNQDGTMVNLCLKDDNSGRQQWTLKKICQTKDNISIFNVYIAS